MSSQYPLVVKLRRARREHMFSALPSTRTFLNAVGMLQKGQEQTSHLTHECLKRPEQANSFQVCFILPIVDPGTSAKLFASK